MLFKLPYRFPDFASSCEAVDRAVSGENLATAASSCTDADVLLGLAALARAGNPVRREISGTVIAAKPDYAPVCAVLALAMDGIDTEAIQNLRRIDPDNALGHYLEGSLLHYSDTDPGALEAFRRGARSPQMRLYQPVAADALFMALDLLGLKGRDRLCALSWMAGRWSNFSSIAMQPMRFVLDDLAAKSPGKRNEISDLLLALAGHLYGTNLVNRQFGQWALQSAFSLKAEVAAQENSSEMGGYAATSHALASAFMGWPGVEDRIQTLNVVLHLPDRVHRAFALVDPVRRKHLCEFEANPPEEDKARFEKAVEDAVKTAESLLEIGLTDPDGIIGPYLRGIPPKGSATPGEWIFDSTPVEKLISKKPELFKAAQAHQQAIMAVWKAGENDPSRRNVARLMEVGQALHCYAARHDRTFPERLDILFEEGYLKAPFEPKSVFTGRPYVYVAAGERVPVRQSDIFEVVLVYDDHVHEEGYYDCVFGSGGGGPIPVDRLKEQLRRRTTASPGK